MALGSYPIAFKPIAGNKTTASVNVTLGGIQLGLSQSSLISSFSKSLDSQLLALSHGNLTYSAGADVIVTLTGIAMTLSQSNLIYRLDKSLASQLLTLGQGNVVYSSGMDVTVTLNGIGIGLSQSNLSYVLDKSLTGNLISANQGNVTFTNSLSLTGLGLSTSQGALAYGLNKTLDSQLLQLSQGALTASVSGDVNVTLTGIGIGLSQGSLAASITSATAGGKSTAHKKKRKPLQHKKQVEDLFGERFAELAGEIQDQLEVLSTDAIDAEIGLLLKATHYKQQLDSGNSKTSDNELKKAYDAAIAAVEYLKLIKRIKDDEEAMTLIISALYG